MAEHLSAQSLERYRERTLSTGEFLRADDHLAACEECRRLAGDEGRPEQVLRNFDAHLRADAVIANEHLSYEQIAALVDDGLDRADREIAESHLEFCRMCTDEVGDLHSYRASLLESPAEEKRRSTVEPAFTAKFGALRQFFALPPVFRYASAIALVIMASAAVLWWVQTRRAPEVATTLPPVTQEQPGTSPGSTETATPPKVDTPKQIVVALNDSGGSVTLDALGAIKGLESLEPAGQQAVKDALTSGRVPTPEVLAGLSGKAGTLMGGSEPSIATFSLISPVGVVIRTDRPRLSWRPLPDASAYIVTVLDADLRVVATSPQISATTWTPPRALERGRVHSWQVTALKDDQRIIAPPATAPEARFQIIDKDTNDKLRVLESTEGRSHLARGVLYAQAGLLDDAERELRALVKANPKSEVARKLLLSVRKK